MDPKNEEKSRMERMIADAKVLIGKLVALVQPFDRDAQVVIEMHALLANMDGEHQTLATAAQGYMDRAAKLEGQRDQVQRELDSTIDQLLGATTRCQNLHRFLEKRERQLSRTSEALTAAENDLADLRWLVRGAREGATLRAAPMLVLSTTGPAQVPPPPHVGGHNATAQAEGGAK